MTTLTREKILERISTCEKLNTSDYKDEILETYRMALYGLAVKEAGVIEALKFYDEGYTAFNKRVEISNPPRRARSYSPRQTRCAFEV